MSRVKKRAARVRCVGCEEHVVEAEKVDGLGYVCLLCVEVLPLIWENELAAVREARRKVAEFIANLRAEQARSPQHFTIIRPGR